MNYDDHIIDKTLLNFKFFGADNALALPDQLENWFLNHAVDSISEVCNNFTSQGEHIEIDQLKIDLGNVQFETFEIGLEAIFKEKLRREISNALAGSLDNTEKQHGLDIKEDSGLKRLFIYFLKFGHMPWEASHWQIADLEKALIRARPDVQYTIVNALIPLLEEVTVQRRLAFNFSASFITTVYDILIKKPFGLTKIALPIEEARFSYKKREHQWKKIAIWLQSASSDVPAPPGMTISKEKTRVPAPPKPDVLAKEDTHENTIYVFDAGIVLMHPFFKTLFSQVKILSGNGFSNEIQREKAIWLLFYLIHGHLDLDESQLGLLKILCGKPLHETLNFEPKLSAKERQEVETALLSAIKHWSALKNTGIDAFRNTFIKREGQVCLLENRIEIYIEQKTADILLDRLPWSLSQIRLPWIDKTIRVNWA